MAVYQKRGVVMGNPAEPGEALLEQLAAAVNGHDLEALESCFAADYRNPAPVHPAQGFTGRAQVRRNWEQIFTFVPDGQLKGGSGRAGCGGGGGVRWPAGGGPGSAGRP